MTLGEMQTYLASIVDDVEFGYFTREDTRRYLNQAAKECQKLLIQSGNNWYIKVVSRPMIVNQRDYALPCDFLKVNRLEAVQNPGVNQTVQALGSCTMNQQDAFPQFGQPCAFYIQKNQLILLPAPNDVRTMVLYYSYRIEDMVVEADLPDVPEEFHEYIVMLAAKTCFLKDGRDPGLVVEKIRQVEMALERDAIERAQDHMSQVVITDGDAYGYPF